MTRPKSYIVIFPKQQNMVHFSNSYKNINGLVNLKVMRIITLVYVGVGVAFPLLVRFIHFKNRTFLFWLDAGQMIFQA